MDVGGKDGPLPVFGSCPYGIVHVPAFLEVGELRRFCLDPSDSRPPLEVHFLEEEELTLDSLPSRRCDGALSNKLNHLCFGSARPRRGAWPSQATTWPRRSGPSLTPLLPRRTAPPQAL